MTDPFDILRADTAPIIPSTRFTTSLRQQLLTALEAPMPDPTTTLTTPATPAGAPLPDLAAVPTVMPYLCVAGAAAAIDFYVAAFGAVEHHRLVEADGRIGHAEIVIGNSRLALADEYPEYGVLSPTSIGGSGTKFTVSVPDVDTLFARALALGATEERPVTDQFYGHRSGHLRDPWGHQWAVSSPIAGFTDEQYTANAAEQGLQHEAAAPAGDAGHGHQVKHHDRGDLYYFTLPTSDLARAQAFFGALLGWRFASPEAGHAENISAPPGGLHTDGPALPELWFVVEDIHAAVALVRELGGTAEEPVHYESGWDATCTDDQGTRFHLSVPAAHYTR